MAIELYKPYIRSKTMDFYLKTAEATSGSMYCFIKIPAAPWASMNLVIQGPSAQNSWLKEVYSTWGNENVTWDIWGHQAASGILNQSLDLFTSGSKTVAFSGSIPAFIQGGGVDTRSATMTLYQKVVENITDSRTLYLLSEPVPTGVMPLYMNGVASGAALFSGIINDNMKLFIRGSKGVSLNDSRYLYTTGPASDTVASTISAYTCGENITNNSMNLFLINQEASGSMNLFMRGYWSTFANNSIQGGGSSTSASLFDSRTKVTNTKTRAGSFPAYGEALLYLENNKWATGTMNTFTQGCGEINTTQTLYMSGANITTGAMNLVMPEVTQYVFNTMSMVMGYGYLL